MNNKKISLPRTPAEWLEAVMNFIFFLCGILAVGCVLLISVYMVISGVPAIQKIGLFRFLFGTRWASTAADPAYGILPFILSSVYGTLGATVIGVPIGLLTAVYMLRASGALELAAGLLGPILERLGIPAETIALLLVRPVSGSAALGVGADLIQTYGPDSLVGRTAAVMLGSTETTFYTIAVYFGAAGIKKTRYTLPAALFADFVGFLMASWTVKWFF